MILSGETIEELGIIKPFRKRTKMTAMGITTTYGQSVAGYDLSLHMVSTPLEFDTGDGRYWVVEPGEFVLASVNEAMELPYDIVGIVHDKSSWARRGLTVQNTVVEPGWRGYLTLELTNHSRNRIILPYHCGIAQIIFHKTDRMTEGYDGKYQDQPPRPVEAR